MLTRHELARLTERLIDVLDADEGESDMEPNGDELDGTGAEDDFGDRGSDYGAGCPISDPGGWEHDGREPH